jgi:hypothetical protein
MQATEDRPIGVLDSPRGPEVMEDHRDVAAPQRAASPPAASPARQERRAGQQAPGTGSAPHGEPVPLGWGSHAERRLVRQVLAFFLLLGLYAAVFIVVGTLVWV